MDKFSEVFYKSSFPQCKNCNRSMNQVPQLFPGTHSCPGNKAKPFVGLALAHAWSTELLLNYQENNVFCMIINNVIITLWCWLN